VSKHTPGPWFANGQRVGTTIGACVAFCGESSSHGVDGNQSITKEECKTNARLIAAAPELLEALIDSWNPTISSAEREAKARAAIAKATGETK